MASFGPSSKSRSRLVLVLGGANMDITASSSHALADADSTPGCISCAPGGVARNAAENLARLGHETRFISVVGDDGFGRQLLEATAAAGVEIRGCLIQSGRNSSCYLSLHGPDGKLVVAVNDMELLDTLTPAALLPHVELVRRAGAMLIDCNLTPDLLQWLFAQRSSGPIFVDAVSAFKVERIRPWLSQVHTLKVNRQEAERLSGHRLTSMAGIRRAAAWFMQQGLQQLALSLGSQGVFWQAADGTQGIEPACKVTVVNTTGAGDALLAGLLHAHLAGQSLAQAVRFAGACAALTLTCVGANHPSLSERTVRQLLAKAARAQAEQPAPKAARQRGQGAAKSTA